MHLQWEENISQRADYHLRLTQSHTEISLIQNVYSLSS